MRAATAGDPAARWFGWAGWSAAAFVVIVVAVFLLTATRVWWVARQDDRPRSDAIVVLGASQYDGRPSGVLEARLRHARGLYDDGVAPHIVTVGGSRPGDRFTEGGTAGRWLVDHGVPEEDVVAIEAGSDTVDSLELVVAETRRLKLRSVVIVTDPWHSLRSREIARDLGLEAVTSPARSGPVVQTREAEARYVFRETVAYLHYRLVDDDLGFLRRPRFDAF